jgi:hypothetical protein
MSSVVSLRYKDPNFLLHLSLFISQAAQSVDSLTIYMQTIGEGTEPVPLWRITGHEYGIWISGRVLLESTQSYRVITS